MQGLAVLAGQIELVGAGDLLRQGQDALHVPPGRAARLRGELVELGRARVQDQPADAVLGDAHQEVATLAP
eukprot:4789878-Alexandrium_andersonii.AAC.2